MALTQDKYIKEKIDSLTDLPYGYTPSLESKWELLQAGNARPAKKQYLYYYAAVLLLLLIPAWLMMNKKSENISSVRNNIPATNKIAATDKINIEKTSVSASKTKRNIKSNHYYSRNTSSIQNVKTNAVVEAPKKEIVSVKEVEIPGNIIIADSIPRRLIVNVEHPKKHKKRYVEMDFDPPASIPELVQKKTARIKFATIYSKHKESDNSSVLSININTSN